MTPKYTDSHKQKSKVVCVIKYIIILNMLANKQKCVCRTEYLVASGSTMQILLAPHDTPQVSHTCGECKTENA